jgi:oligopeptide/dipeptide ABC transporter ATP-binding protein
MTDPLLRVNGLRTEFRVDGSTIRAVDGVDLALSPGEAVGIVGESGSGKTVTAMSILRLIPDPPGRIVDGSILFQGRRLDTAGEDELRGVRGGAIGMVFQDPQTTLNPVMTIGAQLTEGLRERGMGRGAARARAIELLDAVHFPDPATRIDAFPHQLSGGLRQRVVIAMALANEPDLLIADEPTTALDVTVQAEILDLLRELRARSGMALLFITHDIGLLEGLCDRIVVMYSGRVVEQGATAQVLRAPQHPYTRRLLDCVPHLGNGRRPLGTIPGTPPRLDLPMVGCPFAERCDVADARCTAEDPGPVPIDSAGARCHRPGMTPHTMITAGGRG